MNIPKIIAHRGASGYVPENTLLAFKEAAALGAKMVEFDVMLTKDHVPVVIHDENLKRTTNGKGLVKDFTYDELKALDAGKWFKRKFAGQTIPSFESVLKHLLESGLSANVEIKPDSNLITETVSQVLRCINIHWPEEKPLLISSFEYKALELVRSFAPEQPLGYLMHEWQVNWHEKFSELDCHSLNVYHRILTSSRIESIKKLNVPLLAYTVNRARRANKLMSWGVDGVFTDYPDLLS